MEPVSNPPTCPAMVPLFSYFVDNDAVVMVMPFLEGGDLCDVIYGAGAPLSEDNARRYFCDLIHALLHLKRYNIVHGRCACNWASFSCSPSLIELLGTGGIPAVQMNERLRLHAVKPTVPP
eukprot:22041-Eustigmatos_ZCMA.PRE.1